MAQLAFLGAGNLASAIVRGLLERKVCAPADIACTSKGGESARALAAATGITAEPDLVRLLADWTLPAGGIHVVYPAARFRPAKVRLFVEILKGLERARSKP